MAMITLDIKKAQDRLLVGQVLLDNGYRVWLDIQTRPGSKIKTTMLCADKGKEDRA